MSAKSSPITINDYDSDGLRSNAGNNQIAGSRGSEVMDLDEEYSVGNGSVDNQSLSGGDDDEESVDSEEDLENFRAFTPEMSDEEFKEQQKSQGSTGRDHQGLPVDSNIQEGSPAGTGGNHSQRQGLPVRGDLNLEDQSKTGNHQPSSLPVREQAHLGLPDGSVQAIQDQKAEPPFVFRPRTTSLFRPTPTGGKKEYNLDDANLDPHQAFRNSALRDKIYSPSPYFPRPPLLATHDFGHSYGRDFYGNHQPFDGRHYNGQPEHSGFYSSPIRNFESRQEPAFQSPRLNGPRGHFHRESYDGLTANSEHPPAFPSPLIRSDPFEGEDEDEKEGDDDSDDSSGLFKSQSKAQAARIAKYEARGKDIHGAKNNRHDKNHGRKSSGGEKNSIVLKPTTDRRHRITKDCKEKAKRQCKPRNGKPQGVDDPQNELIFQLKWDKKLEYPQIADYLRREGIQSSHHTVKTTQWKGPNANNRFNLNAPTFFNKRGIPVVTASEMNKIVDMPEMFNSEWQGALKWVVRTFLEQEQANFLNEGLRKFGKKKFSSFVHQFETEDKWILIKDRFVELAKDRGNPKFVQYTVRCGKNTIIEYRAKDIDPQEFKCIYARLLNDEFINNRVLHGGNHSGLDFHTRNNTVYRGAPSFDISEDSDEVASTESGSEKEGSDEDMNEDYDY